MSESFTYLILWNLTDCKYDCGVVGISLLFGAVASLQRGEKRGGHLSQNCSDLLEQA